MKRAKTSKPSKLSALPKVGPEVGWTQDQRERAELLLRLLHCYKMLPPLHQCNIHQVEKKEHISDSIKGTFPQFTNDAEIMKAADEFADKIQEYLKGRDTEFSCERL